MHVGRTHRFGSESSQLDDKLDRTSVEDVDQIHKERPGCSPQSVRHRHVADYDCLGCADSMGAAPHCQTYSHNELAGHAQPLNGPVGGSLTSDDGLARGTCIKVKLNEKKAKK